jgi:flagellar basal-body rod protein FlgF
MHERRPLGLMDAGLYIAAQGMLADQVRQDQLANDLANGSTPGYKPDTSTQRSFGDLLLSNTSTGQAIGALSTGVTINQIVTDTTPAPLRQTGQPLDFGIAGDGYFAVRTPAGVRYTRDGQFSSNAQGLLVDGQGNPVLNQTGGTISVSAKGMVPGSALGVYNLTRVQKQGYNYFTGAAAGKGTGTVKQGSLEQSGVDATHTMVDMIASLRAYEAGQKAIQTIDETLQKASTQVGTLGGSA